MDIQLDHLGSNSGFNQSRFALQFVVVSDVDDFDKNRNLTWQTTTSLDDEHTPGIFKVTTGLGVDIINCFAPYADLLRLALNFSPVKSFSNVGPRAHIVWRRAKISLWNRTLGNIFFDIGVFYSEKTSPGGVWTWDPDHESRTYTRSRLLGSYMLHLQWWSEYRTSLVFKWSKVVRLSIGLLF